MLGFVGLDIAKDTFTACFLLVENGGQVNSQTTQTFTADQPGWQAFLSVWQQMPAETWHIGLESSGPYTRLFLHHLQTLPYSVYLLSPLQVQHFRRSRSLRKAKTDRIDAESIAVWLHSMWQENNLPRVARPRSALRDLAYLYDQLTQELTRVQNRFRQVLHVLIPELERTQTRFPKTLRHLLSAYPSAQRIAQAPLDALDALLSHGRGQRLALSAQTLQALAATSWGLEDAVAVAHLQHLLALWDDLETRREAVFHSLRQAVQQQFPQAWQLLRAIPGLGERLVALFLALVDNPQRFSSAKSLVAFAGLDPSVYQSGNFQGHGRLSKRGLPLLRHVLFLMAQALVRYTNRFRQAFQHYREQGRSYREAMVIAARKALHVLYSLLLRQVPFQDLPASST